MVDDRNRSVVTLRKLLFALGDVLNAFLLFVFALILGPLGFLRGPLGLEKWFWYVWMLSPSGLLSQSIRAGLEWRLGCFDAATVYLEQIVLECERLVTARPKLRHRRAVLSDFYTLLARSYLHSGHVDDAMVVILRAKKFLGYDRLPGLPRLDAKTAHLVRAGLAAGRLIEGGGLATLFVKSEPQPSIRESEGSGSVKSTQRSKVSKSPTEPNSGQVVPFHRKKSESPDDAGQGGDTPQPPNLPH